ncbi:uncharacterized protein LOC121869079 [Homarus americanus]|uniref:Uncharacterized protein n=1 Tax=Homarus americanus TaxID=6706 RepID=A0A8J5JYC8_HOMAM|nr:uncharacterized protein LOC121869079 [Homarus americanus]XP_042226150.1 uncharacterized protein LOC121869079 [Homarus americanus]XP_042226151.1 uncharacterized protein LOC121869079 [Homarus americanus]KAG7166832.1 hypothetical protein Hamer_G010503 [Homarus americanus]
MDKDPSFSGVHERRKKSTEKFRGGKGKSRRNPKNEGNIMRAEVQRYKDREKSMQNEDSSTVSSRRVTIRQGIYAHGCSSGAVRREVGLSRETKARAEANLSRILELASHGPCDKVTNDSTLVTVSPHRSFLKKKPASNSSTHNEVVSPGIRKEENASNVRLSSPGTDSVKAVSSSQSKRHKTSHDKHQTDLPTVTTRETTRKELSRERRTNEEESQNMKHPEKPETKENVCSPEKKRMWHESAAAAVRASLEEKSNIFGKAKKYHYMVLEEIQNKFEECAEYRTALSASLDSSLDIQEVKKGRMCSVTKTSETDDQNRGQVDMQVLNTMRTPPSTEYLKRNQELELPHQHKELALNETMCPGTTIINPRALLRRYEKKLEEGNTHKHSSERTGLPGVGYQSECVHDSKDVPLETEDVSTSKSKTNTITRRGTRKLYPVDAKADTTQEILSSIYHAKKIDHPNMQGNDTPTSNSGYHYECPKTVVVDALNYLERCEHNSSNHQRMASSQSTNKRLLDYSFRKGNIPQREADIDPLMTAHSSLDSVFDDSIRSKTDFIHKGKHPVRRKGNRESSHSFYSERNGNQNKDGTSCSLRRSRQGVRDVAYGRPEPLVANTREEGYKLITENPFSLHPQSRSKSPRGSLPSSGFTVSNSSVPALPSDYKSFPLAHHSVSRGHSSHPLIDSSSTTEPAHNRLDDLDKPQYCARDQIFCSLSQGDDLPLPLMNPHTAHNIQHAVTSNEGTFPVCSSEKRLAWQKRLQALPYVSPNPPSLTDHPTKAPLTRHVGCSSRQSNTSEQSKAQMCQPYLRSSCIMGQNSYSLSSLPEERLHSQYPRFPESLQKDQVLNSDTERTQHRDTLPRPHQYQKSNVYSSVGVPQSYNCCCSSYSGTRTPNQNPHDAFRSRSCHFHPYRQVPESYVQVKDWVDATSNVDDQLSQIHHPCAHGRLQVAENSSSAMPTSFDIKCSSEPWHYIHKHC